MFHLLRIFKILNTFAKYRIERIVPPGPGRSLLALLLWCMPNHWRPAPKLDHPEQGLRMALQELGPVFIKGGQMLSTRRDLLPDHFADDLAQLQDNIPPFSGSLAKKMIEESLGKPVESIFSTFDTNPMASASVAQVHSATLPSGEEVVIKVIRPGLAKVIQRDVGLMRLAATWIQKLIPASQKFHLLQVVADYEHTILAELDLGREAANMRRFSYNFRNSDLLYVPKVHWDYVSTDVLTMERIYGIPVSNIKELKARGVNMAKLSEVGLKIFFTQVFRDNFFHADMHPGNVYVNADDPENPSYYQLDSAIVGSLDRSEQFLLARQLMAFLDQDYEQMAKLLVQAGWVPEETRIHEFEIALRTICEPIFEKPLDQLEFGPVLVRLFSTARQFQIQALPQFVLLEKTLLHVEGLGRQLYPELDIWSLGRPLLTQWIRDRAGTDTLIREFKRNAPAWMEQLPQIPQLTYNALVSVAEMKRQQEHLVNQLEQFEQKRIKGSQRGYHLAVAAFFAALVTTQQWQDGAFSGDFTPISWLLTGASGLFLLKSLFQRS